MVACHRILDRTLVTACSTDHLLQPAEIVMRAPIHTSECHQVPLGELEVHRRFGCDALLIDSLDFCLEDALEIISGLSLQLSKDQLGYGWEVLYALR